MTTTVHLDRPLSHLDTDDTTAWRDWFAHHGVRGWGRIFIPSELTWNPRSKLLRLQVQFYDEKHMPYTDIVRTKISEPLPFPGGYRVEEG